MKIYKHIRDIRQPLLGKKWKIVIAGAVVSILYTFLMVGLNEFTLRSSYHGSVVGGFVAGALIGTNWTEGLSAGFRVSLVALAGLSILLAIGMFITWLTQTGSLFLYWSSFFGIVIFVAFVPVFAMAGAVAGVLGVVLRRILIPSRFNPPTH